MLLRVLAVGPAFRTPPEEQVGDRKGSPSSDFRAYASYLAERVWSLE